MLDKTYCAQGTECGNTDCFRKMTESEIIMLQKQPNAYKGVRWMDCHTPGMTGGSKCPHHKHMEQR